MLRAALGSLVALEPRKGRNRTLGGNGEAVVRTFAPLASKGFLLRCKPAIAAEEAASRGPVLWVLPLVVLLVLAAADVVAVVAAAAAVAASAAVAAAAVVAAAGEVVVAAAPPRAV
jgi:hypothetical protein